MHPTSQTGRLGVLGRVAGMVTAPRAVLAEGVLLPTRDILATWAVVLAIWAATALVVLSTPVGRQALVDERVRVAEAFGGAVDDATYRAWQTRPPYGIYASSGGRTLLLPVVTLAVAMGLWAAMRRADRRGVPFRGCLSVAVHATVVLALQQVLATPLHLVRESLTSPFNLAVLVPGLDEGSVTARFLGTLEIFGLWWVVLLAFGCAALTGRPARRFLGPLMGVYAGVAALVAATVVMMGGS